MKSAFGVEHSIAKSYLGPGLGYKAASALSRSERSDLRMVIEAAKPKPKYGALAPDSKAMTPQYSRVNERNVGGAPSAQAYGGRKLFSTGMPRGKGEVQLRGQRKEMKTFGDGNMHPLGGTAESNGKRGGIIRLYGKVNSKAHPEHETILRHEQAHLNRTGNPWRHSQRMYDDARRGREEARADFLAYGRTTHNRYPGNKTFQDAYNNLQTKMTIARRQKRWDQGR